MSDIIDNVEQCRACALKHLADALVWLDDRDASTLIRNIYISGNLSHASGHLIKIAPELGNRVRDLRINAFDDRMMARLSDTAIRDTITNIVRGVHTWEPKKPTAAVTAFKAAQPKTRKRGCGCH